MNWTSAAEIYTALPTLLARISSIKQLCDAQVEIQSDSDYWTALKLNSSGLFQWGLLANTSVNIPAELLDRQEPVDRCYAISKSAMKLKSRDCSSELSVLTTYEGEFY